MRTATSVMIALALFGCGSRRDKGELDLELSTPVQEARTCPVVTGITALPLTVFVGHRATLRASASSTEEARIRWTGRGGSFWAPRAFETTFLCLELGVHELEAALSKEGCPTSVMRVAMTCTGVDGGTSY